MSVQFFRFGGAVTDTITDCIFLSGKITTSGNVCTLRKAFATSGYQVTAGKTLYATKISFGDMNNATARSYAFGYADNDVGVDTATARTNPVPVIGLPEAGTTVASNGGFIYNPAVTAGMTSGLQWFPMDNIIIPLAIGGKYPYFRGVTDANCVSVLVWALEL